MTIKTVLKKIKLTKPIKSLFNLRFRVIGLFGKLIIKNYFKHQKSMKLQLGCGHNFLSGWLNSDLNPVTAKILRLDCSKKFPFSHETFDYIFSEHHIEHLSYNDGKNMLCECLRILKPGGRIRIATPDLAPLLGLYTSNKSSDQQQYIHWITDNFLAEGTEYSDCQVINNAFRNWEHQFLYDQKTLTNILEKSGFTQIINFLPGQSADPNLANLEYHGETIKNEKINNFETMVLEGIKTSTEIIKRSDS